MKRLHWEIFFGIVFVIIGSLLAYKILFPITAFWNAQNFWNIVLIICWASVASGYWHQGWVIHTTKSSEHVSLVLPYAVFVVQCVLFVKGIYYHDFALVTGAILVNSAVVFNIYQIAIQKIILCSSFL